MVRADRNYPDVYFGRPGALQRLPYPRGDMDKSYDRSVFDFQTGSGEHQVSSLAGGSRQRTINWNALHVDNYAILERYWTGMAGVGPFVFIDPSDRNLLMPNQASATSSFYDARHWHTSTGAADMGTLLSNGAGGITQHSVYNTRSLRWYFNSSPVNASPLLILDAPYRNWAGYPVVPGLSYFFSAWARPDSVVDTSITMAAKIQWLDATGALVSEVSGGALVMSAGWVQHSVSGVAPAGAVYVRPVFLVTGATVTVNGSVYIDEPMLEQDTVLNTWAPGTGLRPVELLGLTDAVPFNARFRKAISLVLRELAP